MGVKRSIAAVGMFWLWCAGAAPAQEWANKMFEVRDHDFGVVARGAKTEFQFKFRNLYKEELHVESVRSSCGCTIPSVTNRDLKTWDESAVIAEFNTRQYYGDRSATITVTFDKPFRAQVQLNVKGKIRGDVVVEPGKVDFGDVESGRGIERKLAVSYAGRETWKLVDVKSANPHLEVRMVETGRGGGKVSYDLFVRLKRDTPAGFVNDQLYLVTSDPKNSDLPIEVVGNVRADVIVKPDQIYLGSLHTGQRKPLSLTVTGKRELLITKVECDDDCFRVERPKTAKRAQIIPVEFTACDEPGKHTGTISIYTNQGSEPLRVPYFVQVVRADPIEEPAAATEPELSTAAPTPRFRPKSRPRSLAKDAAESPSGIPRGSRPADAEEPLRAEPLRAGPSDEEAEIQPDVSVDTDED